jgi:hypothetical protein
VLEAGTDMVLAAHRTPIRGHLITATVETVLFLPTGTHTASPYSPYAATRVQTQPDDLDAFGIAGATYSVERPLGLSAGALPP